MRVRFWDLLVGGMMTAVPMLAAGQALDYERAGAPVKTAAADPAIAAAIGKVSPEAIHKTIERLVAFGNRSTISSEETDLPAGTGVLAAADWIHGQFEAISKGCGGCLEVKDDVFVYTPPAPDATGRTSRYAKPTKLHNVYAVMRGSDPAQAKRMYLITGHYDTRNSDTMDAHGFAPGANDDSSGTAVSLETARVLSGMKLPATLVFVAVAGEEQGLNGSHHLAELAKSGRMAAGGRAEQRHCGRGHDAGRDAAVEGAGAGVLAGGAADDAGGGAADGAADRAPRTTRPRGSWRGRCWRWGGRTLHPGRHRRRWR